MEVIVHHLGDVQFEVIARNHTLICDQPVENAGYDEGMTPPELMLSSLGTCAGYYAAQYLSARGLAAGGLQVRVTAEKAKGPARLSDFQIEVQLSEELSPNHEGGLLRAVEACLIHNTLLHSPSISTRVMARLQTLS